MNVWQRAYIERLPWDVRPTVTRWQAGNITTQFIAHPQLSDTQEEAIRFALRDLKQLDAVEKKEDDK